MAIIEEVALTGEHRIVLSGVSWELYEQLRENEPFLEFEVAADESAWGRGFRAWVRERFVQN
ncbi:MAG TPA: hypothetical protein VJ783_18445 [Pirellulales bacterium]|nr:hypothetical protein [Pirellulales bacterium]